LVEEEELRAIVESVLFAAGEPVSLARLGNALEGVPREAIKQALIAMAAAYREERRGLVLEEIAGGFQLRTRPDYAPYVRRLLAAKPPRLSRPLLETLAVIAYRPRITRPEIEQLRGVDTGGVLETLLERDLIRIAGRKDAPGRPIFYETTSSFLELFGLKSLDDLPEVEEFRAIEGLLADRPGEAGDGEGKPSASAPAADDGAGATDPAVPADLSRERES
jgi:segregation and condensation protein B